MSKFIEVEALVDRPGFTKGKRYKAEVRKETNTYIVTPVGFRYPTTDGRAYYSLYSLSTMFKEVNIQLENK